MKTQSVTTLHCVTCGRVVYVELEAGPTQCCGRAMAIAVPGTTTENAVTGAQVGDNAETPPANSGNQKPR